MKRLLLEQVFVRPVHTVTKPIRRAVGVRVNEGMFSRKAVSATGSMKIDAIFTNLETTGRFLHVLPVVGTSLAY
jgi:hypothetical protein